MSIDTSYPTSVNRPPLRERKDAKEKEPAGFDPEVSQELPSTATYEAFLKEGFFEEALQAAERIALDRDRMNAFTDICKALVQADRIDQAKDLARKMYPLLGYNLICDELLAIGKIDQAIEFVNNNSSICLSKSCAFKNICKALTKAGQFDQALQIARTYLNGYDLKEALSSLCKAKAKTGFADEALHIVKTIAYEEFKQDLLSVISKGLAESGDAVKSTEVAYMILDENERSFTFEHNAKELVKIGAVDQALEVANRISNDYAKRRALIPIQKALEKNGEGEKAQELKSKISSLPFSQEFVSLEEHPSPTSTWRAFCREFSEMLIRSQKDGHT